MIIKNSITVFFLSVSFGFYNVGFANEKKPLANFFKDAHSLCGKNKDTGTLEICNAYIPFIVPSERMASYLIEIKRKETGYQLGYAGHAGLNAIKTLNASNDIEALEFLKKHIEHWNNADNSDDMNTTLKENSLFGDLYHPAAKSHKSFSRLFKAYLIDDEEMEDFTTTQEKDLIKPFKVEHSLCGDNKDKKTLEICNAILDFSGSSEQMSGYLYRTDRKEVGFILGIAAKEGLAAIKALNADMKTDAMKSFKIHIKEWNIAKKSDEMKGAKKEKLKFKADYIDTNRAQKKFKNLFKAYTNSDYAKDLEN